MQHWKLYLAVFQAALLGVFAGACRPSAESQKPELTVFAAASLREVATDLANAFTANEGTAVALNFAGSNTLAQQIRAAPVADIFLSADQQWVSFLDQEKRTVEGSGRPFLRNQLVVIARTDSQLDQTLWPEGIVGAGFEHLALADPEAVPAGRYAKASLERLEIDGVDAWSQVASRVVPALDVRAALQLVASDPEVLGIVYRTDARSTDKVRVVYELPLLDEVPIVYWATRIAGGGAPEAGARFMEFLATDEAAKIAERHGFRPAS